MKRGLCVPGASTVLLVLATSASAQTRPLPVLPPEPVAEPAPTPPPPTVPKQSNTSKDQALVPPVEATEPPQQDRPRPRPWDYALALGVRWDSNIDFLVPDGPSGFAVVPRGAVARNFWSPRGLLRAKAAGRWNGYPGPGMEELNRYYTTLDLDGTYITSPSTTWTATGEYSYGYSDDGTSIIVQQGVPLPLVKTRSIDGNLALSHEAGTHTILRASGRFYRTEFELPILQTGQSWRAGLELERRLNYSNRASVMYAFEDVLSDSSGRTYATHFGSLRWSHIFSSRSGVLLEAGASYTPDAELAGLGAKQNFFGGASFARQVGRSTASAFVRREVTPAFGLGVSLLETRVGASLDAPMGRDWRMLIVGGHVQPNDRQVAAYTDGILAISRVLGERLAVSVESRYRRRGASDTGTGQPIESFQIGVFVTVRPLESARLPALTPYY